MISFAGGLIIFCVQGHKTYPPISPNKMILFLIFQKYIKGRTTATRGSLHHVDSWVHHNRLVYTDVNTKFKYRLILRFIYLWNIKNSIILFGKIGGCVLWPWTQNIIKPPPSNIISAWIIISWVLSLNVLTYIWRNKDAPMIQLQNLRVTKIHELGCF